MPARSTKEHVAEDKTRIITQAASRATQHIDIARFADVAGIGELRSITEKARRRKLHLHDEAFYQNIAPVTDFVEVTKLENYHPVPDDWWLLITDVQGSTKAIEAGRYKDVNALGVASIVAVTNAIGTSNIPFVFGGDGATLLLPSNAKEQVEPALRGLQKVSLEGFGLGMRAGLVQVGHLRDAGHDIQVARFKASPHVSFAMLSGSGISEGERWIKDPELGKLFNVTPGDANTSFQGFECRWSDIRSRQGEMLSLLVTARGDDAPAIYARVISEIDELLEGGDGRPVSPENLIFASSFGAFTTEAALKSGSRVGLMHFLRRTHAFVNTSIGRFLARFRLSFGGFNGATYRDEVTLNCDFRKFDDTLRMILDVTIEQRAGLEALLERERASGAICYGLHAAPTALMTCMIGDYQGDHMHFVDGGNGGYAMAAKQLKAQLKAQQG